jgi:hypothetical protein
MFTLNKIEAKPCIMIPKYVPKFVCFFPSIKLHCRILGNMRCASFWVGA